MIRALRLLVYLAVLLTAAPRITLAQQAQTGTQETPPAPEAAAPEPWPLMKVLKGTWIGNGLESVGTNVYGWVQHGFAGNPASPRDRVNFGTKFDWRSNDYRLNQVYFIVEKTLAHENKWNIGYRVDFLVGHDAPFFVANGLLSDFTGFDPTSGVGVDGPKSFRNVNRVGIDFPQFYLETHLPRVITAGGLDVRVGKFYTFMGRDVYPAVDTDFYSRTYENVYATPFTHTGVIVHAARHVHARHRRGRRARLGRLRRQQRHGELPRAIRVELSRQALQLDDRVDHRAGAARQRR
jgi:Putative beta-barrel porin-2, OmpL-like. bbp2